MKNGLVHLVIFLTALCSLASAQPIMDAMSAIDGSIEVTYQSRYMWRGFDFFPNKTAVQMTADVSLPSTGFGVRVDGHRANSSGFEARERWDYSPYYQGTLNPDSQTAVAYRFAYTYYNFPDLNNEAMDMHELQAIVSLPNIAGDLKLVPAYAMIKTWPYSSTKGGSVVATKVSGFMHVLMLNYEFEVPGYSLDTPEQIVRLHSELIYNDGVNLGPGPGPVDHDWSTFVLGAATDFALPGNITLTPALNYQISMDNSVHNGNELWATLAAKFRF